MAIDYYENQHLLTPGMVMLTEAGDVVKLDRRVPGDGTKWYVADLWNGTWAYMDGTHEPGDFVREVPDPAKARGEGRTDA